MARLRLGWLRRPARIAGAAAGLLALMLLIAASWSIAQLRCCGVPDGENWAALMALGAVSLVSASIIGSATALVAELLHRATDNLRRKR